MEVTPPEVRKKNLLFSWRPFFLRRVEGGSLAAVTDANLTAVEASGKTVMLEFFAPWCALEPRGR